MTVLRTRRSRPFRSWNGSDAVFGSDECGLAALREDVSVCMHNFRVDLDDLRRLPVGDERIADAVRHTLKSMDGCVTMLKLVKAVHRNIELTAELEKLKRAG